MTSKYDDMIHLPHPTSSKHPRMSALSRAAQFAAFAALTGHEEAIEETAERHGRIAAEAHRGELPIEVQ